MSKILSDGLKTEEERTAYNAGFDSGLNGPNLANCSFTLFSTPEKTKAWQLGLRDGILERELAEEIARG